MFVVVVVSVTRLCQFLHESPHVTNCMKLQSLYSWVIILFQIFVSEWENYFKLSSVAIFTQHVNWFKTHFRQSSFSSWWPGNSSLFARRCVGPLFVITKTCLYNFDPLKPYFYTVKLGFTGVYIIFLILLENIGCGTRTNRLAEAVLTSTHNLCFEHKYGKYQSFSSEHFQFWEVKFSIYLNRRVFVMVPWSFGVSGRLFNVIVTFPVVNSYELRPIFYFIVSDEASVYLMKIKVASITSETISYHFISDWYVRFLFSLLALNDFSFLHCFIVLKAIYTLQNGTTSGAHNGQ